MLICGKFAEMIPASGRMVCAARDGFLASSFARLAMPVCFEVVTLLTQHRKPRRIVTKFGMPGRVVDWFGRVEREPAPGHFVSGPLVCGPRRDAEHDV